MSWIEDEAERVKAEQKVRNLEREYDAKVIGLINGAAPSLFLQVMNEAQTASRLFNERLQGDKQNHIEYQRTGDLSFRLHKSHYPAVLVEVEFDRDAREIKIEVTETLSPRDRSRKVREPSLTFAYESDAQQVGIRLGELPLTVEAATKKIFDPILHMTY